MIGKRVSHYRIEEQIGAGGMGVVYRAHDDELQRSVALKVLPPGLLAEESARRRFRKEALALAKLNHSNIATVHEFGNEQDLDFLVTEYIAGETLDQKLASGPLAEKEVVRLGSQLAQGLEAAHAEGIVHRDLKPGNLRITPDGRLKILDFGLAQLLPKAGEADAAATLTQTQVLVGTLPYMAPEQLRGEENDERSDIWAAGAVLYEMATGRRAFSGDQRAAADQRNSESRSTSAEQIKSKDFAGTGNHCAEGAGERSSAPLPECERIGSGSREAYGGSDALGKTAERSG
jgi:eukaryotic-like serine/threonine-protein kinase